MRLRFTPLFIASVSVIVFGFYYIFHKAGSDMGPIAGILVMLLGILCLGINVVFRIVFRRLFFLQIITEVIVVVIIGFVCYKQSKKVLLHIPPNFKGNIVLVYGVVGAPKLKPSSFFYRNIDVDVPASGIVIIGNTFADKYFNNLLLLDNQHYRLFEPDNGVGYNTDTLRCGRKIYKTEVLYYTYPLKVVNPPIDTPQRDLQKIEARKLIGSK